MIQTDTRFYVYRHINLDTNETFYIGKGCGKRFSDTNSRNIFWKSYIKENPNWKAEIVFSNLCEQDSYDLESKEIEKIGRRIDGSGTLVNILPGGRLFPESYLIYRNKKSDYSGLTVTEREKADLQRKELFDIVDNFCKNKIDFGSKIDDMLLKNGYRLEPEYNWNESSEEERLKIILDEHNIFIHNFKISRNWAKSIKEVESVEDLGIKFINKMYNLKENSYRRLYEK